MSGGGDTARAGERATGLGLLRPEVLQRERPDGGLELLDPLNDHVTALTAREVRALRRRDPLVTIRLEQAGLVEGPRGDALRDAYWAAKARGPGDAGDAAVVADLPWAELAAALPEPVAPAWRDPERWRRLAEDRAAGQRYLRLPGLVPAEAAAALADELAALAWTRLETDLVQASRHLVAPAELPRWRAFMLHPAARALLGAVIGRDLPAGITLNAWRLDDGDRMGVHPDGRDYRGTLSLGLCSDWRARDGGAIAFGDPTAGGFDVRERWFPHAGDACVFAPDDDTWHAVEPVVGRRRLSLTGWWTEPDRALSS